MSSTTAGRPRTFDENSALQTALSVFWRQGYEATSLDDLTEATGLSRSSFYACFGSKHAALIAAVRRYVDERFARLQAVAASHADPCQAVRAIMTELAHPDGGERGCLFVNVVTELAPDDAELAALSRAHLERLTALLTSLLLEAGFGSDDAARRADALLSCAIGATIMRKGGISADRVGRLLAETDHLLRLSSG